MNDDGTESIDERENGGLGDAIPEPLEPHDATDRQDKGHISSVDPDDHRHKGHISSVDPDDHRHKGHISSVDPDD